jgi:hypothetical protein
MGSKETLNDIADYLRDTEPAAVLPCTPPEFPQDGERVNPLPPRR